MILRSKLEASRILALLLAAAASGCGGSPDAPPPQTFHRVAQANLAVLNPLLGRWDLTSHTLEGPGAENQLAARSGTYRAWPTLDGAYVEFWSLLRFDAKLESERVRIWRGLLALDASSAEPRVRIWSFSGDGSSVEASFDIAAELLEDNDRVMDLEGTTGRGTLGIAVTEAGVLRLRVDDAPGTAAERIQVFEFQKR